jgi:NAD(P)H-flavin reductase
VRGPYGAPFPIHAARGKDLLIVAGGIGLAPLRPLVYQALAHRSDYRRVILLIGARSPADLVFRREVEGWQARSDLTTLVTVDRASSDWTGRVGVVTALLAEANITGDDTVAFACGPEVMMRFTVRELDRRGVRHDRIHLSMERNMKCAVGFCGHCQYGPSFICKDGPVLPYDRIRSLFFIREV